jgi:hypothetical protein
MTEVDLDAIEARVALASPAPWSILPAMTQNEAGQWSPPEIIGIAPYGHDDGDIEFIAHARQDVPAMAAEIRRLRAEVQSARSEERNALANMLDIPRLLRVVDNEVVVLTDWDDNGNHFVPLTAWLRDDMDAGKWVEDDKES